MPPAKFLPVQNSTWGIISQLPFIISDLFLIILTAVTVLLDQETSLCVLRWICSSYILVFLNTYLGARFCPVVSLIFKWFCPVNGLFFFSPFCVLWFSFLRHRQQGKLWSLEHKSETVVRNCGFQPPSSFPFFRAQSLAHSDAAAVVQEPPASPGLCGPPMTAEPCPGIIQAWVPHLHFPVVATKQGLPFFQEHWWCWTCRERQEWFQQWNGQWNVVTTMLCVPVTLLGATCALSSVSRCSRQRYEELTGRFVLSPSDNSIPFVVSFCLLVVVLQGISQTHLQREMENVFSFASWKKNKKG